MPKLSNVAMLYQIRQPVLSIKTQTTLAQLPQIIGESFARLSQYIAEQGELLTDVPYVMYHDYQNMNEQHIEIDVGFPIAKELSGENNITAGFIPGGNVIFCMYRGDYGQITPVYDEMAQWIKEKGYRIKGPCYEYYYNGPEFPQSDLLTKVVIPIE